MLSQRMSRVEGRVVYVRTRPFTITCVGFPCTLNPSKPSMAVLVWLTLLPVAAVATAITLSYRLGLLRLFCPLFLRTR